MGLNMRKIDNQDSGYQYQYDTSNRPDSRNIGEKPTTPFIKPDNNSNDFENCKVYMNIISMLIGVIVIISFISLVYLKGF
jgi:hypothetical protein